MHVELPLGAFIAALLALIPLPWHWRARNVPTLSIVAWLFASNVIFGINSIIWAENVKIVAQVWCDIATKIQVGATMALPACCLCLCIHLERISSVRHPQTTQSQKRRRMIFDCLMCWGLPMVYMALHYIVQGHRYDIVENFGCRPSIYNSVPSILIIWVMPLFIVFLTCIYAALSLVHFFRRRLSFARLLQDSNSALTTSRYFRLMAMAIVQMVWGALVMVINVWFSCRSRLHPWTNWADVHFNFSRVAQFPAVLVPGYVMRWTFFTWWTIPMSSLLFFAFFSFGEDAVKEYMACVQWVARVIFRRSPTATSTSTKSSLPSFVRPPVPRVAVPKFNQSTLEDTQSMKFDFCHQSPSFETSSSFMDTPTTLNSFATDDSHSTFVVPSPTCPSQLPKYSSLEDTHV